MSRDTDSRASLASGREAGRLSQGQRGRIGVAATVNARLDPWLGRKTGISGSSLAGSPEPAQSAAPSRCGRRTCTSPAQRIDPDFAHLRQTARRPLLNGTSTHARSPRGERRGLLRTAGRAAVRWPELRRPLARPWTRHDRSPVRCRRMPCRRHTSGSTESSPSPYSSSRSHQRPAPATRRRVLVRLLSLPSFTDDDTTCALPPHVGCDKHSRSRRRPASA